MENMIAVTIPYRRGCFSPRVAAYLQAVERALNHHMASHADHLASAVRDGLTCGRGVVHVGR